MESWKCQFMYLDCMGLPPMACDSHMAFLYIAILYWDQNCLKLGCRILTKSPQNGLLGLLNPLSFANYYVTIVRDFNVMSCHVVFPSNRLLPFDHVVANNYRPVTSMALRRSRFWLIYHCSHRHKLTNPMQLFYLINQIWCSL